MVKYPNKFKKMFTAATHIMETFPADSDKRRYKRGKILFEQFSQKEILEGWRWVKDASNMERKTKSVYSKLYNIECALVYAYIGSPWHDEPVETQVWPYDGKKCRMCYSFTTHTTAVEVYGEEKNIAVCEKCCNSITENSIEKKIDTYLKEHEQD